MTTKWPYLLSLVEKNLLDESDLFLAEELLNAHSDAQEKEAALLAALSCAMRAGHLCLSTDPKRLEEMFPQMEKRFIALIQEALLSPYPPLFQDKNSSHLHPLCLKEDRLYFQKYALLEEKILLSLKRLSKKREERQEIVFSKSLLTKEQKQAITTILNHPISFLTGGPGTGKTFTAFYIAKTLYENLPDEQKKQFSLILAAPTGKASDHLKKGFHEFIEKNIPHKTGTLHSLLGIRKQSAFSKINAHLHASLILIDESSMIDAELFCLLLESLSDDAKVVFMGDPHQLPSVGVGCIFNDLCALAKTSGAFGYAHLSTCLRSEREELLELATLIKEEQAEPALLHLEKSSPHLKKIDLGFESLPPALILKKLFSHMDSLIPSSWESAIDPLELLQSVEKVKILSTLRKGPLGVDAINAYLKEQFAKKAKDKPYWIAPIILLENDKEFQFSNGQSGVALFPNGSSEKPMAYFFDAKPPFFRAFPLSLLPKFDFSYCLSVHKSQGSEYNHVIFLAPKGSEHFGKEILYTALTRAKNILEIDMDKEIFLKIMQTNTKRFSGIPSFELSCLTKRTEDDSPHLHFMSGERARLSS